jgi:type IV pilus assembly protein PilY1
MKRTRIVKPLALAALLAGAAVPGVHAQQPVTGPLQLANSPLYIGVAARPRVMLTLSRDEELFRKAYNDYTDLDGDGSLDITYKHSIDYYGYFDPIKCYSYDTTNNRFAPAALSPFDATTKKYTKYCDTTSGRWSGNFLNWATMTRVDAVRKLLFGGLRSVDDTALTVLERSYLPQDSHSFSKYYNGADISKLTPFNPATTAPLVSISTSHKPRADFHKMKVGASTSAFALGDQVVLTRGSGTNARTMYGTVSCVAGTGMKMFNGLPLPAPVGGTVSSTESCSSDEIGVTVEKSSCTGTCGTDENNWKAQNLTRTGLTICNATAGASSGANAISHTNTNPPLMRVAAGNFMLWTTQERLQCAWRSDSPSGTGTFYAPTNEDLDAQVIYGAGQRTNGNRAAQSGLFAGTLAPSRAAGSGAIDAALGSGIAKGDFVVRVEACKSEALIGTEKCRAYPTTNATFPKGILKPVGMLQIYGQGWGGAGSHLIDFGLVTGSYMKSFSGGVLRKNIGSMDDEVDTTTGQFNTAFWNDPAKRKTPGNIIGTMSRLRLYGYNYPGASGSGSTWYDPSVTGEGSYTGPAGDNCYYLGANVRDGSCTSWGNPLSEIYYEALRYLAGGKDNAGAGANNASADYVVNPADITGAWSVGGAGCANGNKDCQLGLALAQWQDSINSTNYCAPFNALVFSASTSTNEMMYSDEPNFLSKTPLSTRSLGSINAAATNARDLTNKLGNDEGITGNSYFIGRTSTSTNKLCDGKTVSALGEISGICPEASTKGGSYLIAGLAYRARTSPIRGDYTAPSTAPDSLRVSTYGITLSTNTPRIPLQFTGETTARGFIQPTYRVQRWETDSPHKGRVMGGTLVEFRVVSQTITADKVEGVLYASWEDSERGGDFDHDVWGLIRYCMQKSGNQCVDANGALVPEANSLTVETRIVSESTDMGQGFGYVLSGTTADGAHFHSGINGSGNGTTTMGYDSGREPWGPSLCQYPNTDFPFYDKYKNCLTSFFKYAPARAAIRIAGAGTSFVPVATTDTETAAAGALSFLNRGGGCRRCQVDSPTTSATFALGSSGARPLQDPLFYAAKYGGFKEYQAGNDKPDLAAEWDAVNNLTGAAGSDGQPDNYFLVSNPLGLEEAMDRTFTSILAISSASSVATNSTSLNDNSRVYQARFNSRVWSGQLLSFVIDQNGNIAAAPDWDAALKMPTAANRKILTYNRESNGSGGLKGGVPFTAPNLDAAMATYLQAGGTATDLADRVDYLRGSDVKEGLGAGQFRRRPESTLGDIINSNPIFVGAPSAPYSDASYAAFKTTYKCRQPLLVVGANDGMLHVFGAERDPNLGCSGTDEKGVELLAFVPSFVDYKLAKLTQQNYIYDHRYFVDGTPTVADAWIPSKNAWRTIAVGTMGAGGQGLFALDLTDPSQFSESNAKNLVMWQFTDKDDPDLGYTYSDVRIVKMNDGRWAAVFGNGYNNTASCPTPNCAGNPEPERPDADSSKSTNGEGWLFIVFLDKDFGSSTKWNFDRSSSKYEYVKLPTRVGSTTNPNGLATPNAVDVNNDGMVDYIYAGDLQGNMWKFDVTGSDPGKWCAAWTTGAGQCDNRTPVPLYKARDNLNQPQPITSAPEFMSHPNGGYLVYFGTGIYLRTSDRNSTGVSTFYGIWDKQTPTDISADINSSAPPATNSVGGAARASSDPATQVLLPRKWISSTAFGSGAESGVEFRAMDPNPTTLDWSLYRGWYIDFKDSAQGERMVYDPQIRNGKMIFTTLIPIDTATNPCLAGGTSWLTDVDALTGGPLAYPPFDVNGDRSFAVIPTNLYADYLKIGGANYVPVSRKSQVGITPKPTVIGTQKQDKEFKVSSGSSGLLESVLENPGSISRKVVRRAWREVIRN